MTSPSRIIQERLDFISFLKNCSTQAEAVIKSISAEESSLLPVGPFLLEDHPTIDLLTKWKSTYIYPSKSNATIESTRIWLRNQKIDSPNKILFLVVNAQGIPFGHMGLASIDNRNHVLEIEDLAWSTDNVQPNIISNCLDAMLEWAKTTMYVQGFRSLVFSNDLRLVRLLEENSFKQTKVVSMTAGSFSSTDLVEFEESDHPKDEKLCETILEMTQEETTSFTPDSCILTAGPSISQYEGFYAYDAALNGWNSDWSKYIDLLQHDFKEYIGVKHALATSSCTGALHIALMALGIGKGDEVIVPDQTWVATANAVKYVDATPIFADINPDDWTIDTADIERLISSKTKAIMPVHMYGHPAKMDQILEIARKYNLFVVEDAAPSIGAEYNGNKTGSFGHFAAFSFQGAKLMVAGEGGMLLTDNDDLFSKAKKVWDQGRNSQIDIPFWIDEKGLKYKMSNIQAAIGLGQLARIETLIAMKRRIFAWYQKYLFANNTIKLNSEGLNSRSIYWMTSIELLDNSPVDRNELMQLLRRDQIDTRPVFPAISQYPIWDREDLVPRPVALHVGNHCMNLPSGVCLSEAQVQYVCARINFHTGIKNEND